MNTELNARLDAIDVALAELLRQTAKPPLTPFQKVQVLYGETVESLRAVLDISAKHMTPQDVADLRDVVQEALDRLGTGPEEDEVEE